MTMTYEPAVVVDCSTGEQTAVPLTPEQEAARTAEAAAAAVANQAAAVLAGNERTIRTSFGQAMTRSAQIKTQMDTIQAATFANNGQRDAAIKSISEAVEDLNTAIRKLIRLADNRLDAAD